MTSTKSDNKPSKEMQDVSAEANKSILSDADLRSIKSAADVQALFDRVGAEAESFADYGSGFTILTSKDRLVGVRFVILEWRFTPSAKYGSDFASMAVVTESGEKWIVNDGSTGICSQLRAITDERIVNGRPNPQMALRVDGGLRKSTYSQEYTDEKTGELKTREAATFYLA